MSEDFLQAMAESSRERVLAAMAHRSHGEALARAQATPEPPPLVRHAGGFDLIAEVKLRSPAAGLLKSGAENVDARVTGYATAGAAAISVLTEPSRFDGSMAHLESAARALAPHAVPAMRKDFLVDPYQVLEARAAGAGGVLVILRMLPRAALEKLIEQALDLNLFALLEAFDEQDIELAHSLAEQYGPALTGSSSLNSGNDASTKPTNAAARSSAGTRSTVLVGVNCRDLVTLKVVPGRLEALAHLLPTNVPRVAESGVGSAEDARRVAEAGYEMALVGSALMTANDPHVLVREMLAAGRSAHASSQRAPAAPPGRTRGA